MLHPCTNEVTAVLRRLRAFFRVGTRKRPLWIWLIALGLVAASAVARAESSLRIAVAQTALDTGLFGALAADYHELAPRTQVILLPFGALATLDAARSGKADLVITHHAPSEEQFVHEGYGVLRTLVMYNEFAVFGPSDDPLRLRRERDPLAALRRLAGAGAPFFAPDNRSGTQRKLAGLWDAAGVRPDWVGYEETSASPQAALRYADLFGSYTFADLATYFVIRGELGGNLVPLVRDHVLLRNDYSAIVVNRERVPGAQQEAAQAFLEYLVSDRAQDRIRQFGQDRYQAQIFVPAASTDAGLLARRQAARESESRTLAGMAVLSVALVVLAGFAVLLFLRAHRLERGRRASEERLRRAVEGTADGVWDWDLAADRAFVSPRLRQMLGHRTEEDLVPLPRRFFREAVHPDDWRRVEQQLDSYLADSNESEMFLAEFRTRPDAESSRWMLMRGKATRDAAGRAVRVSGSVTDITERKRQEAAIAHLATHDTLTGLPNRALLHERLAALQSPGGRFALLVLDLDGFKEINDGLGHHIGDLLLQQVGQRLRDRILPPNTVARLGGDEFAVVIPLADTASAERVAREVLLTLEDDFLIDRHNLRVGGSLGIAMYPDDGTTTETIIRHADVAMYNAKRSGRGIAFYDPTEERGCSAACVRRRRGYLGSSAVVPGGLAPVA